MQNEIQAYLGKYPKMIKVVIYEISIISCYYHLNLLLTAITCTTISTVMKFLNYI